MGRQLSASGVYAACMKCARWWSKARRRAGPTRCRRWRLRTASESAARGRRTDGLAPHDLSISDLGKKYQQRPSGALSRVSRDPHSGSACPNCWRCVRPAGPEPRARSSHRARTRGRRRADGGAAVEKRRLRRQHDLASYEVPVHPTSSTGRPLPRETKRTSSREDEGRGELGISASGSGRERGLNATACACGTTRHVDKLPPLRRWLSARPPRCAPSAPARAAAARRRSASG